MSKTVLIENDTHELIVNKQKEMKEKYEVDIKLSSIVDNVLKRHIREYDITQRGE